MIPGSAIPLLLATAGPTFNPRSYFDVKLYTGNGSTQTISGLNFSPDLVWIKARSAAYDHQLGDTVRGVTNILHSNLTAAESTLNTITGTSSDGFTVSAASFIGTNANGQTFAAWTWDAGSSTVTNTQGSISSQVRANASAGFSVCTFTGNGTQNATVGHGLGVAPALHFIKNRSSSSNWVALTTSINGSLDYAYLNSTAAFGNAAQNAPTSTVFSVWDDVDSNANGSNYVAYCFAPVAGYSSFGSYTGNGSATGPVISGLGFQPYFVMIKASSTTGDWWMYDGARSPSNPRINKLKANTSGAEDTAGEDVDFQLDGFQIKTSDSGLNQNAATYIYAAFA
jgi:hypothetical protein